MEQKTIETIYKLKEANGANAKKSILLANKDNEEFTKFLFYLLNPFYTYKVSERSLREAVITDNTYTSFDNIFDLCERLNKEKAMNNQLLTEVIVFLNMQIFSERELYIGLLSKTLKLGVTNTTVNKIIKNLIPEWEVQQAYPIDKYPIKDGEWFTLTQKLNGVRCTYYKGKLYARSGEEYEGLDHIIEILNAICEVEKVNKVFDGELTLIDNEKEKNGYTDNEAFRVATGIINSNASSKKQIQYTIFDAVPCAEFEAGECAAFHKNPYRMRRAFLNHIASKLDSSYVHILPTLYQGTDQSVIPILLDKMVKEDKEGLMLNLDVPYQRKRHRGILKIKRFYTMDLPIVDYEAGSGRLEGTLGAFVVDYKGNRVNVGSGFTDEQRALYWENRDELIGTLCEVKYKEVSYDKKTGAESLQFPVFVGLRTDKKEISYA